VPRCAEVAARNRRIKIAKDKRRRRVMKVLSE
jgi:hypothetical protein